MKQHHSPQSCSSLTSNPKHVGLCWSYMVLQRPYRPSWIIFAHPLLPSLHFRVFPTNMRHIVPRHVTTLPPFLSKPRDFVASSSTQGVGQSSLPAGRGNGSPRERSRVARTVAGGGRPAGGPGSGDLVCFENRRILPVRVLSDVDLPSSTSTSVGNSAEFRYSLCSTSRHVLPAC